MSAKPIDAVSCDCGNTHVRDSERVVFTFCTDANRTIAWEER